MKERSFSTENTRYQFNGKEFDSETETSDFGARNSDGDLGIWETPDPYENIFSGISPYAYAFNNPIRFIDVAGMWPLDANLHILIGKYDETTVTNEGNWTVIRATSLESALEKMTAGKKYDNLLISTHGSGNSGEVGGFMTGGGQYINNIELGKAINNNNVSKQLAAFTEILSFLGKEPNIVIGACNAGNSERFNELIYEYIESKIGTGFSLYASTAYVRNSNTTKPEPLYTIGLADPKDIKKGMGFRLLEKGGKRSEETFNIRVQKENPWIGSVFDFSKLSHVSTIKIKSKDSDERKTIVDSQSSGATPTTESKSGGGSSSSGKTETIYRKFQSDPQNQ